MTIIVTGGDGLLGHELCSMLRTSNDVVSLVHHPVRYPMDGVKYIIKDLSKPIDLADLPDRVETIFHLAQSSRFRDFPSGVRDVFEVNTRSTLELLEYCREAGGRQFFLASTGGVYGEQDSPITEAGLLIPPSEIGFYFASKLASEMFSSTYRSAFDVTVLRFFFMYGKRQRSDMFLPRLISRVKNGEPISVRPDGGIRMNPVYVQDAASFLAGCIDKELPPVINIGGPDIVSIQEIAETIGEIVERAPVWVSAPASPDIVADITVMRKILGDQKLTSFMTGLTSLLQVS